MAGKNRKTKKRPSRKQIETRTAKTLEAMQAYRVKTHLGRKR